MLASHALYVNYNQLQMGIPTALKQSVIVFLKQFGETAAVLIPRLSNLPELAIATALILLLLALAMRIWRLPLATKEHPSRTDWVAGWFTLAIALALILSTLFPHVLGPTSPLQRIVENTPSDNARDGNRLCHIWFPAARRPQDQSMG